MTVKVPFFQEGDKSTAICPHCRKVIGTTLLRRDVSFSDGQGLVKDVLVAICDVCETVVAIPAQSTTAIREARQ